MEEGSFDAKLIKRKSNLCKLVFMGHFKDGHPSSPFERHWIHLYLEFITSRQCCMVWIARRGVLKPWKVYEIWPRANKTGHVQRTSCQARSRRARIIGWGHEHDVRAKQHWLPHWALLNNHHSSPCSSELKYSGKVYSCWASHFHWSMFTTGNSELANSQLGKWLSMATLGHSHWNVDISRLVDLVCYTSGAQTRFWGTLRVPSGVVGTSGHPYWTERCSFI